MNNHKEWNFLSAYLDGVLGPASQAEVEHHLRSCSSCSDEILNLRETKLQLAALPHRTASPEFMAVLEKKFLRPSWREIFVIWIRHRPLWQPIGALALISFLIGGWVLMQNKQQEEIPMELLLAAHSRYQAETYVPQGDMVAANYSGQLVSYYSDEK